MDRPFALLFLDSRVELWRGNRSLRDPGFMNPIGALETPGDSGRIVWGIFVLTAGAHERTRGCSPRAPGRFRQNHLGGFVSGRVCVHLGGRSLLFLVFDPSFLGAQSQLFGHDRGTGRDGVVNQGAGSVEGSGESES